MEEPEIGASEPQRSEQQIMEQREKREDRQQRTARIMTNDKAQMPNQCQKGNGMMKEKGGAPENTKKRTEAITKTRKGESTKEEGSYKKPLPFFAFSNFRAFVVSCCFGFFVLGFKN
jgi:hypothetical protein